MSKSMNGFLFIMLLLSTCSLRDPTSLRQNDTIILQLKLRISNPVYCRTDTIPIYLSITNADTVLTSIYYHPRTIRIHTALVQPVYVGERTNWYPREEWDNHVETISGRKIVLPPGETMKDTIWIYQTPILKFPPTDSLNLTALYNVSSKDPEVWGGILVSNRLSIYWEKVCDE